MITVPEIREHVVDLLDSENDKENALSSFEDWLVQTSWNMHQTSDLGAQQFVADIELSLAENEGDYELLWKRLKEILHAHPFSALGEKVQVRTASSTSFKNHPGWPALLVGNPLAKASV